MKSELADPISKNTHSKILLLAIAFVIERLKVEQLSVNCLRGITHS